jgi:hypothetical protein
MDKTKKMKNGLNDKIVKGLPLNFYAQKWTLSTKRSPFFKNPASLINCGFVGCLNA